MSSDMLKKSLGAPIAKAGKRKAKKKKLNKQTSASLPPLSDNQMLSRSHDSNKDNNSSIVEYEPALKQSKGKTPPKQKSKSNSNLLSSDIGNKFLPDFMDMLSLQTTLTYRPPAQQRPPQEVRPPSEVSMAATETATSGKGSPGGLSFHGAARISTFAVNLRNRRKNAIKKK